MKNAIPDAVLCHRILNVEQAHAQTRIAARAHIASPLLTDERSLELRLAETMNRCSGDAHRLAGLLADHAADWCKREQACYSFAQSDAVLRFVATQNSPQGLLPGCMLQNFAHAANCHEPVAAHAHAAHVWHSGALSRARSHGQLYLQLLQRLDLYLPGIDSPTFQEGAGLLPSSWALAAYRLALSLFPKTHAAEILGSALFESLVPISPVVYECFSSSETLCAHPYLIARSDAARMLAQRQVELAIEHLPGEGAVGKTEVLERVVRGYLISMRLLEAWHAEIAQYSRERLLNPAAAMVDLIRSKSRFASGYHSRLKLADLPFDDYVTRDPENFVRDLGRSRWIVRGKPEQSLLLTRLIGFGGPMFRVFSDPEIDVIHAWIASLDAGKDEPEARVALPPIAAATPCGTSRVAATEESREPSSLGTAGRLSARELYHQLLNSEDHPGGFDAARAFAELWLARAAAEAERGLGTIPFANYTHERLRHWFEEKAIGQARSYGGPGRDIEKSREQVIDEAVQLCPMVFVDGGWIQRWANACHVETDIGALLYKIFSDEIGNGDTRLNHPNIYRKLMDQMGVDLPDFRSPEFAASDLFSDDAFEVPAFWLSISQFPRRFLPETLGLNLAMELSGVGGAYRTARDELRHYGFDTLFVDLHNTIDNVSTGHSAMALQAIELYMDEVLSTSSQNATGAQWQRIWTGFCSLAVPRRSWKEVFVKPAYAV